MSKKITFTSIMTAIGTVASVLACIYAIKAYESSKTPTFPLDDAYTDSIEISSLTKNAHRFEEFLGSHVGRVVYLNVYFDPDSGYVDVDKEPELSPEEYESYDKETKKEIDEHNEAFDQSSLTIWTECYEGYNKKLRPGVDNYCTGITISFLKNPNSYSSLDWFRGAYYLKGFFQVVHYSGPYQGFMVATLRGESAR
ncbi:hypothetical protein [Pectobacterium odoriferum]|uniref:hypothetical protein n=1 Tax=Pectobacterium odoriferum TaxID=78398 RepID=UPI00052A1517|nr:hypothetical protein [Pectobacterium odoriferum]AIU88315.1 hypothetical protein BCS7_09315 [Pectobacterium odoriferum]POE20460.1 hypothetical protein BV918_01965 [Pectobacterium odoriferum]POE37180.1 hypothetical protein BV922_01960 [Pectobacterium odoriferum]